MNACVIENSDFSRRPWSW